ncbi:MAG TPA: alkaline phosphatase family protein [Pyrinomonadaceae bacterium]|nr:alkaline phosphatase family protein [Pyrinomonadaceae bacterium]
MRRRKVLLAEINEITWDLLDPWIEEGKLPTFARLKREGAWGAPLSVDLPPQLDPWITWTTVYTGRTQAEHNVFFLQQPPESIRAERLWELCRDGGLKVGVYGSLCSWPPQPVEGFYVPDTFAPDPATYPDRLRPIQELNLTYTRSVRLPSDQDGAWFKARLGAKLLGLGLGPGTVARIVGQLARERFDPASRWRRVALQPFVNFDFFSRLYRRHRPDFATFHTNHVAHYMHTYWKAMRPELFPLETGEAERRAYGGAIEHGYRTADELLRRMAALLDEETVLVVASSMGQKPFVSRLKDGKRIAQVRSLERLLAVLGVSGRAEALATMSDQFNIYPDTDETRDLVLERLGAAYVDTPARPMFYTATVGRGVTVNLRLDEAVAEDSRCFFPHSGESFLYEDLVYHTGHVKSGCHDPRGVLLLYGAGVRRGARVGPCDNLDLAPTLLALLGLPAPASMKGRVLAEAFAEPPAPAAAPQGIAS